MKKTILTILSTLIVLILLFFVYISSGAYDISQLSPHNGLTKSIIRKTTHSSINKRMGENTVPTNLKDTTQLIAGFKIYDEMCLDCHGSASVKQEGFTEGLYPKPPKLFKKNEEDAGQEFFWIIKNGIKMTSMPAYKPILTDDKIWAVTAFVTQKIGKMSAEEYNMWSKKYGEEDEANEHQGKTNETEENESEEAGE